MNKKIVITVLILFSFFVGFSQQNAKERHQDKTNQPQTDIKVNKEFDEKGNLIRYDSTYTYFYSSDNISPEMMDSLMNSFNNQFGINFYFGQSPFYDSDNQFFNDSIHNQLFNHHKMMMEMQQQQMEMMKYFFEQMQEGNKQMYEKLEQQNNYKYKNETDI